MTTKKRTMGIVVICSMVFALVSCSDGENYSKVPTDGRLTITGLEAYNGKQIFAVGRANRGYYYYRNDRYSDDLSLFASESITGNDLYNDSSFQAKISSGQAILNVYKLIYDRGPQLPTGPIRPPGPSAWGNYVGNDKNITFKVVIVGTVYGFVTVSFVDGIAEAEFLPDLYNFPHIPLQRVDIEMVNVPGGSFEMGSGNYIHTVTLTGFKMGKYEVTQAQYQAVMGDIPDASAGIGDNYPVYGVSWYATLIFCNRLSLAYGLTPVYRINNSTNPYDWGEIPPYTYISPNHPNYNAYLSNKAEWDAVTIDSEANGFRLPTEAQWEYAARGGNGSPGNYSYAGSNNPDDVAWYKDNSGSTTHVVGTKAPNGLGLYDMSGNVAEWCWDWSGDSSRNPQTDPMGPPTGYYRITRGGSWDSWVRHYDSPYSVNNENGFRIVRP